MSVTNVGTLISLQLCLLICSIFFVGNLKNYLLLFLIKNYEKKVKSLFDNTIFCPFIILCRPSIFLQICVQDCVCVFVCVCVDERERESEGRKARGKIFIKRYCVCWRVGKRQTEIVRSRQIDGQIGRKIKREKEKERERGKERERQKDAEKEKE